MSRILRQQAARQDLVNIVYHYIQAGSPATARRFRDQAEVTFQRLAGMRGIGARYEHDHPALAELRFFPISGFSKYLVFYRPIADGIEIARVLHGARDIHEILAEDLSIDRNDDDET